MHDVLAQSDSATYVAYWFRSSCRTWLIRTFISVHHRAWQGPPHRASADTYTQAWYAFAVSGAGNYHKRYYIRGSGKRLTHRLPLCRCPKFRVALSYAHEV